ncbi:MAG TPA: restriction endonuclease subunit M, partial [Elusimicrobia bacterium]|nr:restriction endonuclease subunit M [Elusimicrobiota bacterium]
ASSEFGKHPEVRKLNILAPENIARISEAYEKFKKSEGFSRAVTLEEIKNNDYNLNVTLYVYPEEETEDIDVEIEWRELKTIEDESAALNKKIEGYLREIK